MEASNQVIFEESIGFALSAMAAARDTSASTLIPILGYFSKMIEVDRLAIARIRGDELFFHVGVGIEMEEGERIELDLRLVRTLKDVEAVKTPTPGVGWDYILAIRGGEKGELRACLLIDDTHSARELSQSQDMALKRAANLISWISGYDIEYKGLRDLAVTDSLTSLPARRYIDTRLSEIFALSGRHNRAFFVGMVDADHFKAVNDTYGHPVGDKVLRHLGQTLREITRKEELCGRYGGEEFLFAGFGSRTDAEALCVRICEQVRERSMEWTGCPSMTVSVGAAIYVPGSELSLEQVIELADTKLYAAKRAGRNCYRIC